VIVAVPAGVAERRRHSDSDFIVHIVRSFVLVVAAFFSLPLAAQNSELSSYKLGSGDMISIRVLGEDDLKRERVRLSDAGTISFPVLGEIRVKGMTVGALEDHITKGLRGRYLLNPQVNIAIDEYRNFYVNGMVEKPGGYPFSPGLTVRKAISIAGGFKERAARDKISIIRDDDPGQTPKKVDLSVSVQPGDILTIEESFF
jgi:protein involved in polysaccharide export with SLBB domain